MADDIKLINEAYGDTNPSEPVRGIPASSEFQVGRASSNVGPTSARRQEVALKHSEKQLIIEALWAITPLGGGSTQFHLAQRLEQEWGLDHDPKMVGRLQLLVAREVQSEMEEMGVSSLEELGAGIE